MAASPPKPPSIVQGEALLQSLGYNQQLKRKINVLGNLALVLSDITPTASLLIVGTVVIVTAGTGSIAAYLIGCFLAINVALCMGELGSMFPVAGGLFSIVTRVLGKPIGFLAMLDYMGQAVFLPASVAVGIGVYISVLVASIGIALQLGTFLLVVFGVPDIKAFVNSATPMLDAAKTSFGDTFHRIVAIGAIIAILNACLAITLQFARIVWAAGRDRAWPTVISEWIGKVEPARGAPWVATLIVGALATILSFQGGLIAVVTFTAVLLIVLYGLICISALVSRFTQRDLPRPWKMPLWPAPPIIGLVGVAIALSQQKINDLLLIAGVFAAGLIYYYVFIQPRGDRYWNVQVDPNVALEKLRHET